MAKYTLKVYQYGKYCPIFFEAILAVLVESVRRLFAACWLVKNVIVALLILVLAMQH